LKHTQGEDERSEGTNDLCKRLSALHLKDETPKHGMDSDWKSHRFTSSKSSVAFLAEGVRHHWAPQFRRDSLPTKSTCSEQPVELTVQTEPLQPPGAALCSPPTIQNSYNVQPRGLSIFFLPDCLTIQDPIGRDEPLTTVTQLSQELLQPSTVSLCS
jgi:hypothetical protein